MTYLVRPVTLGDYGVYKIVGENKAEIVFEGTQSECYEEVQKLETESENL